MRVTKTTIETMFGYYCEAFGLRRATSWNDVGGYKLDYQACYGGWRIERINNIHGGVMDVMFNRYSNKDFYNMLQFALKTEQERKHNLSTQNS